MPNDQITEDQSISSHNVPFDSLKNVMKDTLTELEKFQNKRTKVGGTRLRKLMSLLGKECKEGRSSVLSVVKSIPIKSRGGSLDKDKEQPVDEQRLKEAAEVQTEKLVNEGKTRQKGRPKKKKVDSE